ncbi:hypothetical protein KL930_001380 [Ogataea haglerorum]|uniref:Uncharacterized protein n=1 Tax=Ogataea haglerorum TaxID=1937702 RepID=A0AAN6D4F4_9ASCO|nr:hypothetical protein KL951_001866 [Ogataea haglerorum]KAG7707905.1 hypothetical protein KL950_002531 [Ogataea haglerorum]KAG7717297.1 hypothetical protein KL913_003048 [Ogataea haglerorum]KAG7719315.1 hypothetical protein KL949_002307 [Ogataea haglerorum]KAG7724928.1 hypothetical protein KL948_005173 [Ogataea haglerorum]
MLKSLHLRSNVHLRNHLLIYRKSVLSHIYGANGLTASYLSNFTQDEQCKIIYRNLIRLLPYLKLPGHFKRVYTLYIQMRFREDYEYKRNLLINVPDKLTTEQLSSRLINTINFVSNACSEPHTEENIEFRILRGILQHESSKYNFKGELAGLYSIRAFSELLSTAKAIEVNPKLPPNWYSWLQKSRDSMVAEPEFDSPTKKDLIDETLFGVFRFERNKEMLNESASLAL